MGLLSLVIALGSSLIYIIQSILKLSNFDVVFRVVSAVIAIICILFFAYNIIKQKKIYKSTIAIIYIMLLILVLYILTKIIYGYEPRNYTTQLLMFGVHAVPAVIMGSMLATSGKLKEMIKWLQPIMLLYTINITIAILSSDVLNSEKGVQAFNNNELNYQTISYYIVLALAINIFIIINFNDIDKFKIFKYKSWRIINIFLIIVQVFCLLSAGGRGGTVLFIVTLIYNFIVNRKLIVKNYKNILKVMIVSFISIIGGICIFKIPYVSVGLNRVLGFFLNGKAAIINDYRITYHAKEAIDTFLDKPILGHGLGSVFYKFGIYTHNIFTDTLVEGGIIYTIIVMIVLIIFLSKICVEIKYDFKINIIFIIFMSSFTMLLFSGYYLSDTGLWFALGFIFTYRNKNREIV